MRNVGAALLGAITAIGVCAAVVVGGAFTTNDKGSASTAQTQQVAHTAPSSSGAKTAPAGGSLSKLYSSVKNGVVYVQAGESATGSGFVISDDGYIVTNEHVVAEATSFTVRVGENGKTVPATLVGADAATDLALLKVDPAQTGTLHPLPLGESDNAAVGDEVIAIGSPFGLQSTLTSGIVSALGRSIQSPSGATISGALQTDAAINPGNSGGPLIDSAGQVIGVNAQIASSSGANTGVGFAISIDTVKTAIAELKAGGGTTSGSTQPQSPSQTQQGSPSQTDPYGYGYGSGSPGGTQDQYGQQYALPGAG
ncbi:MAG: trypsin-like serine protease [Solirubrobacterales bacterium]|jgi:putative serine protease PepD|nr:trypsin-like serine protease [Solirubrobacterales bacterium]